MNSQTGQCPICRHVRISGHRCQSPALTGSSFCFFHRTLRQRCPAAPASTPLRPETVKYLLDNGQDPAQFAPSLALNLPPLEDAESIQLVISLLFAAIAARQIDPGQAHDLLYALQIASSNLRILPPRPAPTDDLSTLVRRTVRTRGGQSIAAPSDGNGVPSQATRPKSALELFLEEHCDAPTPPPSDGPVKPPDNPSS